MNLSEKLQAAFSAETQYAFEVAAHMADREKRRLVVVGGVVRDMILNQPIGDADLMTEYPAFPYVTALAKELNAGVVFHEKFLTSTITLTSGHRFDLVTAREESYLQPAQLPVVQPASIEKDLKRRDFTINAMACFLNKSRFGEVIDPFSGQSDIKSSVIRVLHDKSFVDDPTRLFRAARFAGRLGFAVEPKTEQLIRSAIADGTAARLTPVRRRHEFELLLKEKQPAPAFAWLSKWGALAVLHPDWSSRPITSAAFPPNAGLEERLVAWLGPWGKEKAEKMMTDLSFEKSMKRNVLSKLVQSPSIS